MLKFKIAKQLFPIQNNEYRYFGHPSRIRIDNWSIMERLINCYNKKDNCFLSLATYNPNPNLHYIFFDLDKENAMEDAIQLALYFDRNDYQPYYILNSGTGYHVLLKIKNELISKFQYKLFYEKILADLNLKSFDNHVKGDINRLIRIPGTENLKNNSICHLLKDESYDPLDAPQISLVNEIKDINIHKINEANDISDNLDNFTEVNYVELHDFTCLENRLKEKEPLHIIRMLYTSILINQGYSDLEIFKKLKSFNWIDWDPRITIYQIRHIRMNKYIPSTCKSLKKRGLCDQSCEKYQLSFLIEEKIHEQKELKEKKYI